MIDTPANSRDLAVESKTAADLGWPELLEQLASRCSTPLAKQHARALSLVSDADAIDAMLDLVGEARAVEEGQSPFPFGEIQDLRPITARLRKEGVLQASTLVLTACTLRSIDQLARFVARQRDIAPKLGGVAANIRDLQHVWGAIDDCFDDDGELANHASAELGTLRRRVIELHKQVTQQMKRLMDKPRVARFLSDRFFTQRENRYVLPVRADAGPVLDGIVLGSSSSGATLFIEPREVVGVNNQLKVAQLEVAREESRILGALAARVAEEVDAIEANLANAVTLDLIVSRARLAMALRGQRAAISRGGHLALRRARHPLMVLAGTDVVPHDIELDAQRALIISGPNAGGKTVSLKTVGLCALMLRAGMQLPVAAGSELPVYSGVLSDIGDDQSIEQNLSTFTAHLSRLLEITREADRSTLVLIDEIVTGTDPGEGEVLAQAVLESLTGAAGQVLVTTHYERLKALPLDDSRFVNACVGFDLEAMRPTFTLHIGAPGTSFALSVAERLGIHGTIVSRATELLDRQQGDLSALLVDLADRRTRLERELSEAESARRAAARAEQQFNSRRDELSRRGAKAIGAAHQATVDELTGLREQLGALRLELRRNKGAVVIKRAEREAAEIADGLARNAPPRPDLDQGQPVAGPEGLAAGQVVLIPDLNAEAEVLEPPRRGQLTVMLGGLRTQLSLSRVRLPSTRRATAKSRATGSGGDKSRPRSEGSSRTPPELERSIDNTLDMRGMRVDEALREAELFIDQALLAGRDAVFLLHGHGSGALRGAVRSHLALAHAVERVESADPEYGGDAVTVAWLR